MTEILNLRTDEEPGGHGSASSALAADQQAVAFDRFRSLRQLLEQTRHRLWRFSELDPHIHAIEELIFSLDDMGLVSELFLSGLSADLIAMQQVAYCRWETELERRFVEGLCSSAHINDYSLAQRFRRLIAREVELLEGAAPKRLLFIGSGPVPVSAILLHESLGVPVDCIDADADAVVQSRELLRRLSLSDSIHVERADGITVDTSRYDAVLIALLAKPKADILAQVAASASPDCRVICRTSLGLRVLVYEPMDIKMDLNHFRIADDRLTLQHGDTISSLLLKRLES